MPNYNLERLKTIAEEVAAWRGHKLGEWAITANRMSGYGIAYCATPNCNVWVQIETNPMPNSIDIGGPAVAVGCPYEEITQYRH